MRKVLALLLAWALLFSMGPTSITASAATEPTISIEDKNALPGDEVSIVIVNEREDKI